MFHSKNYRITNDPNHDPSNPSFIVGLSNSIGLPSVVKEQIKCSESSFKPMEMENFPSL